MNAVNFNDEFPASPKYLFRDHYLLLFDLASLQEAAENIHYPKFSCKNLRLDLLFESPLRDIIELIVLRERVSTVKIEQFRTVAENF